MSFRVLLAALAALMLTFFIAAPAKGDVTLNLGNFVLSGGQSSQEIVITGLSGQVTSMDFAVDFVDFNGTGSDAASDLALLILPPAINSGAPGGVWWGGSNFTLPVPNQIWQGTWSFLGSSSNSGFYQDTGNNFATLGIGPNPWRFVVYNGWSNGPSVGYNNVTVTLKGSITMMLPGDLNNDQKVNAPDLALLLGFWGSTNATADLDHNGIVGAPDLALLLGAWTG